MSGVLGFDASLTCAGFAYTDRKGEYHTGTIKPKKLRGVERLYYVRESFKDILNTLMEQHGSVPLIVYEGYAMGTMGGKGRFFDIGELGGVLKLVAWSMGIDVLLVPPSNLKKYATGKGNADKDAVMASIASNWGYSITQNDEADAFVLLKMGEACMAKREPRKVIRREALRSCSLIRGKVQ